jgi:hypothetical protein
MRCAPRILHPAARQRTGDAARATACRGVQAMRLEHLERQKALAEAEAEAEMLGNFIRLADWMVCENLLLVVVGACDEYYKQIQRFSTDEKMLSKNGARLASLCHTPHSWHGAVAVAGDSGERDCCVCVVRWPTAGMFLTSVSFGETSITFTPFLAEIREVIKDFQDQMITTVHQVLWP